MRIGGCIVLYNPGVDVLKNIHTYLPFLEQLVVVDNSTKYTDVQEQVKCLPKIVYINQHGNLGIASALNAGLNYLCEQGVDLALTMDQDSCFPVAQSKKILKLVEKYIPKYAIVGLRYKNDKNTYRKPTEILDVNFWITSGNFVKLTAYKEVGGFQDDLFIDSVDHEFCHQLVLHHYKIGIMRDYCLNHTIGDPGKMIRMFGTYFPLSSNHSAIRYYYRFRNVFYLYQRDKKFYRPIYYKEVFINIPRILLFDSNKAEKWKMIKQGIHDAKNGRLGAYRPD